MAGGGQRVRSSGAARRVSSPCPPSPAPPREQMLRGAEKQQQSCQFMCHFLLG